MHENPSRVEYFHQKTLFLHMNTWDRSTNTVNVKVLFLTPGTTKRKKKSVRKVPVDILTSWTEGKTTQRGVECLIKRGLLNHTGLLVTIPL